MTWERAADGGYVLLGADGAVAGRIVRGPRLDALTWAWRTYGAGGRELPCSGWQFPVFARREVERAARA